MGTLCVGAKHSACQLQACSLGAPYVLLLCCVQASAADKDNFFSRKIAENASRPEGLPPSQGACVIGVPPTAGTLCALLVGAARAVACKGSLRCSSACQAHNRPIIGCVPHACGKYVVAISAHSA